MALRLANGAQGALDRDAPGAFARQADCCGDRPAEECSRWVARIDAALDATHRTAVASLIKKQAHSSENQAQFITTTFRPEFVSVADAHFGISLQHKTSRLHKISKEDATAFVTENATNEQP